MNGIDSLRKKYIELSPEERVSMFFNELITHRRDEVILALRPTNSIKALKASIIESVMLLIAGHALTSALLAERKGLVIIACHDKSDDEVVRTCAAARAEAAAWALALKRLQQETGLAFVAAASLLDSHAYLASKIAVCAEREVDFTEQYNELASLWALGRRQIQS